MSTTLVGARVFAELAPLATDDASYSSSLEVLCDAQGIMFEQVAELVEPGPNGEPPWSALVDVDRCPTFALPWLGQIVGVTVDTSKPDAQQRQQIRDEDGMKRGTVGALVTAAQATLTGGKTVIVRERDATACPTEPAYGITVVTFTSETPDPTLTEAAARRAKAAGLVLQYLTEDGQDFEQVREDFATFADLAAGYATFDDMRTNTP